nr:hypothetical protein [Mycobacterium lepraemurium]
MSRVAPLAEPWSEEDAAGINGWGHPDRSYEPLLLVRCLQRHPALASRLRKLGESLYVAALFPPRTRTITILRTCALIGCEYEWAGGVLGSDRRGQRRRVRRAGHRRPRRPALEPGRADADRGGRRAGAHRVVVRADLGTAGAQPV